METNLNTDFNFSQAFAPVTDAQLLFQFIRFRVYQNIPEQSSNPAIDYLTIIATDFESVGESAILGLNWVEPEEAKAAINVRTRLLIHTGSDMELWSFLIGGIVQHLAYYKAKERNGRFRIIVEKVNDSKG